MPSENIKIKINEYDKTSPAGRGTDSTDIAYVPGFSCNPTAPTTPTLCTSVREFETYFGTTPKCLDSADVTTTYSSYGFNAGDFDRSYVFAKELLYQGMPVVYHNLGGNYSAPATLTPQSYTSGGKPALPEGVTVTYNTTSKEIEISTGNTAGVSGTYFISCTYTVPVAKDKVAVVDIAVSSEDCKVVSAYIMENNLDTYDYVKYSDAQFAFTNNTDAALNIDITILMEVTLALDKNKKAHILFQTRDTSKSLLDSLYASSSGSTSKSKIINALSTISDKSIYSVKYITSGGYPSVVKNGTTGLKMSFAKEMLEAASTRGDAVALIDAQELEDTTSFSASSTSSFYGMMSSLFDTEGIPTEYGAAMYPWSEYNCVATLSKYDSTKITMPASFGYLMCVAKAIKTSPNWLAMAGVTRGIVPNIKKLLTPGNVLSNKEAEEMQPKFGEDNHKISINCITDVKPYGLTLWGNRTLKPVDREGTVALNFLNTRNMLSDIKKILYTTAKSLMFEQNSESLWLRFKDGVSPLLNQLKMGNGISDFKIIKGTTKYNGDPLTKGELAAVIKVYPMYAVEYFELAVEINDEEVTVS